MIGKACFPNHIPTKENAQHFLESGEENERKMARSMKKSTF